MCLCMTVAILSQPDAEDRVVEELRDAPRESPSVTWGNQKSYLARFQDLPTRSYIGGDYRHPGGQGLDEGDPEPFFGSRDKGKDIEASKLLRDIQTRAQEFYMSVEADSGDQLFKVSTSGPIPD